MQKNVANLVGRPNIIVGYIADKESDINNVSEAILEEYEKASSFLDELNKIKNSSTSQLEDNDDNSIALCHLLSSYK